MEDGYEITLAGLIRKRASLVAEIESLQVQAQQRVADLHALEAVIRLFNPDVDVETLPERRIPPAYAAFRGEMSRFFLETLRQNERMTTLELTVAIMRSRSINVEDRAARQLIMKRTGHAMVRLRNAGHVASEPVSPGGMMRWWLQT